MLLSWNHLMQHDNLWPTHTACKTWERLPRPSLGEAHQRCTYSISTCSYLRYMQGTKSRTHILFFRPSQKSILVTLDVHSTYCHPLETHPSIQWTGKKSSTFPQLDMAFLDTKRVSSDAWIPLSNLISLFSKCLLFLFPRFERKHPEIQKKHRVSQMYPVHSWRCGITWSSAIRTRNRRQLSVDKGTGSNISNTPCKLTYRRRLRRSELIYPVHLEYLAWRRVKSRHAATSAAWNGSMVSRGSSLGKYV